MFSGNFAKGFITGLAESVDREIQKDMAETSENIRRISDIQVERGILDAKEAKAKEKELTKEMKKMQGELEGSADAVQYLIDRFGYEKAKEYSSTLAAQQTTLGLSPLDQIGLAQRNGNSVTIEQLVKFNNPVTRTPMPKIKDGVAVGFGNLFGGDEAAINRLNKMTENELEAYNASLPDEDEALAAMPPALKGKLKPYMLGRLADPGEESKRLRVIAMSLKSKGNEAEAKELKLEADALYLLDNVGTTGKLTPSNVNSMTKLLDGALASRNGLKTVETEEGFVIDPAIDDANRREYFKVSGKLGAVLTNYVLSNGTNSYAEGLKIVKTAIADNHDINYVMPSEGGRGQIVVNRDKKLFVKAGESPELNNVDSGAADAASQASSSAIDTATISIEEQIRSTQPGSVEAAELIAKAKRSNPNFIPPAGY